MSGKIMTRIAAVVASFAAGIMAATPAQAAGDYLLEAGESATLSTAYTNDTMTVNGDLTVSGGIAISSPTINMAGGSITVLGKDTTIGEDRSGVTSTRTTLSMTNGTDGAYGMLRSHGGGVVSGKGLAIYELYIQKEGSDFVSDNGYFDFMSVSNGTVNLRSAYNYSSFTGRITVAGTSAFYRRSDRGTGGIFASGAYKIDLQDDATLTFNFGNQGGSLNNEDCVVDIGGTGTVRVVGSYESEKYIAKINRGAYINHSGPLSFVRIDAKRDCYFGLNDSRVIGPNVTALRQTSGTPSYLTSIAIASGSTITLCGDVEITGTRAYLTGGRIKIDATAANRLFKCNINEGDSIVVEKTGANEMVVSATTNIPNLVVSAGTVRFTDDCFVSELSGAPGATLIADGCTVTIAGGGYALGGLEFATANGGSFVKTGAGTAYLYAPGALGATLHVAEGDAVFSAIGLQQRYWRFTFTGMSGGTPAPVRLRGIYLFGSTGEWENSGIVNSTSASTNGYVTEVNTPVLAANTARYFVNSATNVLADTSDPQYTSISNLKGLFDISKSGKYRPVLMSPLVDSGNPLSYLSIEFRMNDGGNPITGYNLCNGTGKKNDAYPSAWSVYASDDGETWTEVDSRSGEACDTASNKYYTYGSGGAEYVDDIKGKAVVGVVKEHFKFSGYKSNGLEADSAKALSVQVDVGASLDLTAFTVAPQKIGGITIDLAKGGGTIHGGRIAAGGTLAIKNAAAGNLFAPMPLTFDGTSDISNLASWSVVVDGVAKRYKIAVEGETFRLQPPGFIIIYQ